MESKELQGFIDNITDFFDLKSSDQIDYFIYFLTVEKNEPDTQLTLVRECFQSLNLTPYSNISQYLISNIKGKEKNTPKFLRTKNGYQLHRNLRIALESNIIKNPVKAKLKKELREILAYVTNPIENEFLNEAINCFEISAYRASIVMVWNLTVDHLYEYILKHELASFNLALSKNTDKRVKISIVSNKDDFSEIPENKFIEFCRSANIISNDVRKILEAKLGIRNSYAHPSNIVISESKANEFIEDIIKNVILKYKL